MGELKIVVLCMQVIYVDGHSLDLSNDFKVDTPTNAEAYYFL